MNHSLAKCIHYILLFYRDTKINNRYALRMFVEIVIVDQILYSSVYWMKIWCVCCEIRMLCIYCSKVEAKHLLLVLVEI